ncbi:MAG TPA: serine/threonine-protein kinase [Arthrobacter sp.]|nr:serine/threonine-protein kinase [Arthrobacter sp.]
MADSAVPEVPGFTVGRELGRGGSSTVWLVTDERTGTDFALKCFVPGAAPPGTAPEPTAESEVRREIRILSTLDHQHLLKAHDVLRLEVDSCDGLGLLVDYAPGGSLAQLVASRGKLSIGETVTVLTPIAQVLGYLHSQGFTHSDVSPGNVLFTSHGKPLLADVGIARMVGDRAAVPGHGTRGFIDPAPVDAVRAGLQPERDVYSVAALGWYCLTGDAPVRTSGRPPLPLILPGIPGELAAALEAGLNEDRRLRPTAHELAAAIYRSAAPLPVDLAGSVHPTVLPELLTRRPLPARSGSGVRETLQAWRRRMSTSSWSGFVGARQVLPFPEAEGPGGRRSRPADGHAGGSRTSGKHVGGPPEAGRVPSLDAPRSQSVRSRVPGLPARRPDEPGYRATHRLPARRSRIIFLAPVLAVLAVAWLLAAQDGPAPLNRGSLQAHSADSADSRQARDGRAAGMSEARIPEDVAVQLGSADPGEAVQGLASLRSLAFSSGRLELLDQVNVQGSTAAAADERIGGPLRESGHVLAGFTSILSEVRVHPDSNGDRAVVAVTSAASSYEEKDRAGVLVATGSAAPARQLQLVLVPVEGRWRITEILPGP